MDDRSGDERVGHNQRLLPFSLEPLQVERVWGAHDLSPWYSLQGAAPVGEVWLNGPECRVADGPHAGTRFAEIVTEYPRDLLDADRGEFPLLVKMLFPADRLSVQVHPDDQLAAERRAEGALDVRAKTECWYVLSAESGATVALGLQRDTTQAQLDMSLGKADMEALLHHEPVGVNDMVYVDAGTVHAIGPGVVLLEVQQSSDTTYRLWDYGRPRELHLEDGARAIKLQTSAGKIQPKSLGEASELIRTTHFVLERSELSSAAAPKLCSTDGRPECLAVLKGELEVLVDGVRTTGCKRGAAIIIPAATGSFAAVAVGEEPCTVVRCRVPGAWQAHSG